MSRFFDAVRAAAMAVCMFALAVGVAVGAPRGTPGTFGFGKSLTPGEIAGWDIDVRPDGKGLPPGRGTVAQGQVIYDAKCASCHGTFGESTDYIPIAGGVGTLATGQPVRTTGSKLNYATTLFDYIRRAMPFTNPKTLTDHEVYALTAYVLNLNDILPADAALDRDSLPKLRMPNRDGFTIEHGFMRRDGKADTHNMACMRDCVQSVQLSSEIPEYARDSHGNLAEQTRTIGPVDGVGVVAAKDSPSAKPAVASPSAKSAVASAAAKPAVAPSAADLARKSGCLACHAIATKIVGPAFKDIAARYAGKSGAVPGLIEKVRKGGSGAWGEIPMPPQAVSETEARQLVDWILGAK
ncbi:MAG: c-type cytochrome [Casimicrobiaceae bacterium]